MTAIRWAAGLTALVALAGGIISYSALAALARAVGVDDSLSWFYPLAVDGQLAGGSVAILVLNRAPVRTRAYVWLLITGAIAVWVAGNALHAERGLVLPPIAAAGASAVPAMSLAAALHLLVTIVPASSNPERVQTLPRSTTSVESVRPPARVPARSEVRRMLRRSTGSTLTAERVSERLGVSKSHARRLLREERQPHVVAGER